MQQSYLRREKKEETPKNKRRGESNLIGNSVPFPRIPPISRQKSYPKQRLGPSHCFEQVLQTSLRRCNLASLRSAPLLEKRYHPSKNAATDNMLRPGQAVIQEMRPTTDIASDLGGVVDRKGGRQPFTAARVC